MRFVVDVPDEAVEIYEWVAMEKGKELEEVISDGLFIFAACLYHRWKEQE